MDKRSHGDPDRIMEHAEAGYCLSHSEELHLCKYTRSLRSALAIAQARVAECSDREALMDDNIELRSALAEKTAQVERLRDALTNIYDYGLDRDGEYEAERLGELVDELVKLAREALAATALKDPK